MIEQTNLWDCFCNLCISIMENLSHQTGMSYGLILSAVLTAHFNYFFAV